MQIKFGRDRAWHRPILRPPTSDGTLFDSGNWTACGKHMGDGYYATREDSYEGELCTDGCFTQHEFAIAARLEQEQYEYDERRTERFFRKLDKPENDDG